MQTTADKQLDGACLLLAHIQPHPYIACGSLASGIAPIKRSSRVPGCRSHIYKRTCTPPAAHSRRIWPLIRHSSMVLACGSHRYKRSCTLPAAHPRRVSPLLKRSSRALARCSHRYKRACTSPAAHSHMAYDRWKSAAQKCSPTARTNTTSTATTCGQMQHRRPNPPYTIFQLR